MFSELSYDDTLRETSHGRCEISRAKQRFSDLSNCKLVHLARQLYASERSGLARVPWIFADAQSH